MFLYQEWLVEELHRYVSSASQPLVKGRPVVLTPRQYGAALLQAYLGKAPLTWVTEIAGVSLKTLTEWRREPEFLLVMDWSKSRFAEFFGKPCC
jgi:hypothetical protein